jgi:hypothetical protein
MNRDALDLGPRYRINRTLLPGNERLYSRWSDFRGVSETEFDKPFVDAVQRIFGKKADKYLSVAASPAR